MQTTITNKRTEQDHFKFLKWMQRIQNIHYHTLEGDAKINPKHTRHNEKTEQKS